MSANKYRDGWYGAEKELTVFPQPLYPFRTSPKPDTLTRIYRRDYEVFPKAYRPKIGRRSPWTNLATFSEAFSNAAWTKTNVTAIAAGGLAPDGQQTMETVRETATDAEHSLAQGGIVTTATAFEASVFAASDRTRSWIRLTFTDSAAAVFSAFFNVASGYVGTRSAGVTAKIVSLNENQFRCVMTFTPAEGAGTLKVNLSVDGAAVSYAGNVLQGISLWGAQVTPGGDGPYISTTATARAVLAPDRDKDDPLAYLINEEDPTIENSESAQVRREFGRIPLRQTIPGSMFITKPAMVGAFPQVIGNVVVLKPDPLVERFKVYSIQPLSYDSGPPGTLPTGGTYTLTFGADTTAAIAYNASSSAVQAALNALASITAAGGVTVSGTYATGFAIDFPNGTRGVTVALGTSATGLLAFDANAAAIQTALNALPAVTAAGGVAVTGSLQSGLVVDFPTLETGILTVTGLVSESGQKSSSIAIQSGTSTTAVRGIAFAAVKPTFLVGGYFNDLLPNDAGTYQQNNFGTVAGLQLWAYYETGGAGSGGVVTRTPASGGVFKVTTGYGATADLPWNATVAQISAAVNAIPGVIAAGGFTVTEDYGGETGLLRSLLIWQNQFPQISGTFTLTFYGETTAAIPYNASNATIQAAINALPTISARGGGVVSGPGYVGTPDPGWNYGVIGTFSATLTFLVHAPSVVTSTYAEIAAITGNDASLTPGGSNLYVTATPPENIAQAISFTIAPDVQRLLSSANHGLSLVDTFLIQVGANYYSVAPGTFALPDGNSILLAVSSGTLGLAEISSIHRFLSNYADGGVLRLTRINRVTDFFLPGVSPGIAVAEDIPNPVYSGSAASLLAAIVTGQTIINYEVGELVQWRSSPILARTVTTINAATLL